MKTFCACLLLSALAFTTQAQVLVFKSVEKMTLMGAVGTNAYRIPVRLIGKLVLDKDQGTAAYIAYGTYKGQRIYFKFDEISWQDHDIVYRKLKTRDLSYVLVDLNYIRFQSDSSAGLNFRDLVKGKPYSRGLKLIPDDPSPLIFPKSMSGTYRDLLAHPWGPQFIVEGKTLYVFMTGLTQDANLRQVNSAAYVQEVENDLQTDGYQEISDLEDLLNLTQ